MSNLIKLTLSLVVYNNPLADIKKIIDEVSNLELSHHLYILDNSPEKIISKEMSGAGLTVIHSGSNLGFGRGHNVCLRYAEQLSPEAHLFINPDVEFTATAIEVLFKYLTSDNSVGLVTPAVYYPDGTFQYVCRTLPTVFQLAVRLLKPVLPSWLISKVNYEHEMRYLNYSKDQIIPMVNGCFFIVRFETLKRVGYFDERFFMYFEDVDLCRRLGEFSKLVYSPDAKVYHAHQRGSHKETKLLLIHLASAFKYFKKWM